MPKVWIEAYGCSASIADSEMISGLLKQGGFELAKNEKEGSAAIIVTCSVKDKTEHKMSSRIARLNRANVPLVIAGCLPKADKNLVLKLAPGASIMGPHSIDKTVQLVASTINGKRIEALEDSTVDKVNIPRIRLNPAVSIVEIASGCLSECSFCQTKLAKGQLRSYRPTDIVNQIQDDLRDGCREVWLTSTDNGCYGRDLGTDLADLLVKCTEVSGDFKIRVGMLNPMYVPQMQARLIDAFSNPRVFKFLHIPLQSGSDKVLRDMRRGHDSNTFRSIAVQFRTKFPEACIATDIIVGFPSETDADFQKTIDLMNQIEPDVINISRYSARPGTDAAKLKKHSSQVLKSRSESAHLISRKIAKLRNKYWLGWEGEVIIDEINGDVAQGRNYAYKPVILLAQPAQGVTLGQKIIVKITGFSSYALKGKII